MLYFLLGKARRCGFIHFAIVAILQKGMLQQRTRYKVLTLSRADNKHILLAASKRISVVIDRQNMDTSTSGFLNDVIINFKPLT